MEIKKMSSREARANFSELLGSVYYTKQPVMVEKKGKPVAVVVSPEQFSELEKIEAEGWAVIDELRERNKDEDPDEVLAEVTKIVDEVRQERYEKEQQIKKSHR